MLQSGSDIYALQRRDDDTLGMNGFLLPESHIQVKGSIGERGYVCS